MPRRKHFKPIHYRHYEIAPDGTIRRRVKAKGTWPGRIIKHWYSRQDSDIPYVSLCRNGVAKAYPVKALLRRAFG